MITNSILKNVYYNFIKIGLITLSAIMIFIAGKTFGAFIKLYII